MKTDDYTLQALCNMYSSAHNEYVRAKDELEYAEESFKNASNDLESIEKAIAEKTGGGK